MQSEAASNPPESRYQLLSVIARGGQAAIWRARDVQTNEEVALKLLSGALANNADAIERLRRERAALVSLAGTCAVRVIDGPSDHAGAPCVALELLDGIDLETRLSQLERDSTRLSFPEVTQVIEPLVQTLHKAHGLGIVHRDLKPANVFLLRDGSIRLIDFGFARLEFESRMTQFGIIMGSPCYIAPELWHGHADTSGVSVDIYSLGVMVYRMLGGHPPFETQSLVEMRELATSGRRPSLRHYRPDLSERVDEWVERALAADPRDRYGSVRELWEGLCEIVEQPKPGSWSVIPRAVAAGLHPKRVAEALRRAGEVLWGRLRDSDPGVAAEEETSGPPAIGRVHRPRQRPLLPPKHVREREEAGPVSEAPITLIPLSIPPRSSKVSAAPSQHATTAATTRERSKRRKKNKRRRVHKQRRKAQNQRRRASGKGRK
ncbi:MAG TPA: serine/threonine-protein kinase [Polyangiaceae bacterium]|nr:serine/threonine-protein kinase [Polyangiaceae bacterium]